MSLSLHWRPAQPAQSWPRLPYALKSVIARRLWGHDGSVPGEETLVGLSEIDYLDGLADAGVDGALELRNAIKNYGAVFVWIGDGTRPGGVDVG